MKRHGIIGSIVAAALLAPALAGAQTPAPAVDLKVGDPAPAFSLPGTDGKTHTLAQYKGKAVVIAWYPAAFTSGCTAECKSFAENGPVLKQFDVAYFMASVDTPEKNKEFAEAGEGGFPALVRSREEGRRRVRGAERPRHRQPLDVLHRA